MVLHSEDIIPIVLLIDLECEQVEYVDFVFKEEVINTVNAENRKL